MMSDLDKESTKNMQSSAETAEKTADEMFEKLNFKKIEDTRDIRYLKQYTFNNGNGETVRLEIRFCLPDKLIHFESFNCDTGVSFGMYIDEEELQAINKKCKELEWLDE